MQKYRVHKLAGKQKLEDEFKGTDMLPKVDKDDMANMVSREHLLPLSSETPLPDDKMIARMLH